MCALLHTKNVVVGDCFLFLSFFLCLVHVSPEVNAVYCCWPFFSVRPVSSLHLIVIVFISSSQLREESKAFELVSTLLQMHLIRS